ncbi:MAG: prepilin-type N-terminal cleavage/methylation domain-containing protein [Phycisphaerales bacterium]|nr:prepilin-type N-terminal cleavage/methylation domain-containing protein [Phycisphaerales bacterium]
MNAPTTIKAARIKVTRRAVRRSGRGFTLIEVLMAAALGVIVAGACIGLFAAIQRADKRSNQRTASIESMSRLHRTLQRTMRTVLLDLPKRRPAGTPDPLEPPRTRVALTESSDGLQRLEVTLSQPPIMGLVAGRPADPISRYQPVRGLFEMRRPVTVSTLRSGEAAPIELWWVPYQVGLDEPNTDAQVKVADSINELAFRFAKTNEQKQLEKMRTASFTDWSQIPAYVEVQVTTIDGTKAQWMFEVSGSTGMEPGENQADADLPAAVVERYRTIAGASAAGGDSARAASGGTNSSGALSGRGTASSGSSSGSGSASAGSGGSASAGSGSSGGSSGGSSSGASSGSGSSSGGAAGGGTASGNPLANMSISQLIAEFYRRLAERDGNTGD